MASTPVINQPCSLKFLWFILGNILKIMRESTPGFSLGSVTWKKEYNLLIFVRIYIFLSRHVNVTHICNNISIILGCRAPCYSWCNDANVQVAAHFNFLDDDDDLWWCRLWLTSFLLLFTLSWCIMVAHLGIMVFRWCFQHWIQYSEILFLRALTDVKLFFVEELYLSLWLNSPFSG